MAGHEVTVTIRLAPRTAAPSMLHEVVGTIGPKDGPQADMLRNFGSGMIWQVRGKDAVATFEINSLIEAAARLVLEGAAE